MNEDLLARAERVKQEVLQWRAKFGGGMHPGKPAQAAADMIDELLAIINPPKAPKQSHSEWLNEKYADNPDGSWGGHP